MADELIADAKSQDFYKAVVERLPEALVVSTPDGKITYVNGALEALLGYDSDELIGASVEKLVPAQPGRRADAMKWLTRWAHEPLTTQSRFLELIARSKEGHDMPVDVRVVEGDVDGEARFFLTVRDNSAHHDQIVRNKETQLLMSRILAVADDAFITVDEEQKITFFNLAAESMFGYLAEEVMGKPLEILMPDRFRKLHHLEVSAFASGKQASRFMGERGEVVGLRKDGAEFPIEATITKVSAGGKKSYTAHIRDITKRKKHDAALAESQRRFRAIFDHAFEAIGLLDVDGCVLEINRAGKALTDGDEDLIGQPLWELPWIGREEGQGPDEDDQLKDAVSRAAKGETVHYAVEVNRPDGSLTIDISLVPIRDHTGQVVYLLPEGRSVSA